MNPTYITLAMIGIAVGAFLLGRLYQIIEFRKKLSYYINVDAAKEGGDKGILTIMSDGEQVEYFEYDPLKHVEWEKKQEEEKRYALKNLGLDEDEL